MSKYSDWEKEQIYIRKIKCLFPFWWDYYLKLVSHELMSIDELHAYNFRRRQETIKYAYENTIFYRKFYDSHGLNPNDIKTEEDWDAVPLITREMLHDNYREMIVPGLDKLHDIVTTSGSTGKPLTVVVDKDYYGSQSIEWRARAWVLGRCRGMVTEKGCPVIGVNEALLRRTSGLGAVTPQRLLKLNRITYPMKRFIFDSPSICLESMRQFMADLSDEGAYHLAGYVGTTQEFAEHILAGDLSLTFHPKTITCSVSVMTKAARKLIADAFGVVPHDLFGCNEIGRIAVESVDGDGIMNVFSDVRQVDLIDDSGRAIHDNREGRLVVTNFDTRVMPIIKYKLGDITHFVEGSGAYGLPFPRVAQIKGRETDYLTDRHGSKVYGLCAAFDDEPDCVLKFQFIEHKPGVVTLSYVLNPNCVDGEYQVRAVVERLSNRLSGRIEFSMKQVDDISTATGKIRFIVHEWQSNCQ